MTSQSRPSRRESARQKESKKPASRWLLPVVGVVILGVAVLALILSQGASGPGASAVSSSVPAVEPTITGDSLPAFTETIGDVAKGLVAPVVKGQDFQGKLVEIAPNGKPTMIAFLAHWCPHCQREVPVIQGWVTAGRAPADVNMVSVITAIDPTAPNYPPDTWLAREGWTVPVIVDPTSTVGKAYGLSSYPFFVILDGTGKVFVRLSGEIPVIDLEKILASVPRS
jgi:thiol-disulfide isomerase/thioredoxin